VATKAHHRGEKGVSGKKQHGPAARTTRGGNRNSKGQNFRKPNFAKNAGHSSRDEGDRRGPHGGSGGGQDNRQNRSVNRASKMG